MHSSSLGKEYLFHGRRKKSKQINLLVEHVLSGHFKLLDCIPNCSSFYIGFCENISHLINCKWKRLVINHPFNTFIRTKETLEVQRNICQGAGLCGYCKVGGTTNELGLPAEIDWRERNM
jgi:hypothetical protein